MNLGLLLSSNEEQSEQVDTSNYSSTNFVADAFDEKLTVPTSGQNNVDEKAVQFEPACSRKSSDVEYNAVREASSPAPQDREQATYENQADASIVNPAAPTNNVAAHAEIPPFHIGGPNTCLPFFVESFLGWSLCLSCLTVSGYHYVKSILLSNTNLSQRMHGWVSLKVGRFLAIGSKRRELTAGSDVSKFIDEGQWIPLTTFTRDELERHSPWESYLALVRILEKEYPETLVPLLALENDAAKIDGVEISASSSCTQEVLSNRESYGPLTQKADAELIRVLRKDAVCRRLASFAMRPHKVTIETTVTTTTKTVSEINSTEANSAAEAHTTIFPTITTSKSTHVTCTSTLLKQLPHNHLLQRLSGVWNELLVLPTLDEAKTFYRIPTTGPPRAEKNYRRNDAHHVYKISLILPSYNEKGSHLQVKLNKALEMASSPGEVEVIVVDAGGCTDIEKILEHDSKSDTSNKTSKHWGRICIVSFISGGGRGPCLNYGANSATGCILTFCHSDTTLPLRWDDRIVKTLEHSNMQDDSLRRLGISRANSCSFAFGVDTSPQGLSMPFASSLNNYFPPGIRAVEVTANMRSRLYSLPYGDSTLSMHACVFHFLGGYPDQCLMEDYELVSLLRLRAALFQSSHGREKLAMIRGSPAQCSPRRWQKYGVLYVTYTNSRLVNLYAGAMKLGADDLFRLYYGKEPPQRKVGVSPWEIELEDRLH